MKNSSPHTGSVIKLVIVLIILFESVALVYLYKQYRSQRRITGAIQNTLTRTMETVHALQKDVAEKAQSVADLEQRFAANSAPGQSMPNGQNADDLRKRLKESKEMELQMYERIEELSRKQADMESEVASPKVTITTPTPAATATGTAGAQPTPPPTATSTLSPTPQATDTPITQESPPQEMVVTEETPPAGEITGQILIVNDTYNFIIVNVGSDNGIDAGDEGIIEHADVQIGRAKVKKIYNKMCLADIVETSPDTKIQKNYLVKFIREPENSAVEFNKD